MTLILASSAPWKLEVLTRLGLAVEGRAHGVDESTIELLPDPEAGVQRRAEAKAVAAGVAANPAQLVVGLDQAVVCGDRAGGYEIHAKAATAAEAERMLSVLAGRRHALLVGWAVVRGGAVIAAGTETVTLAMRPLSPRAVRRYVATGEWQGVAGCYRYEGVGRQLFTSVDGDRDAIVGVPVRALLTVLRREGADGLIP